MGKGQFIGYVVLVRLHILVDTFNVTTASRHTQKPGWTAELNMKGKTVVSLENKYRVPLRIQWRTYKAFVMKERWITLTTLSSTSLHGKTP